MADENSNIKEGLKTLDALIEQMEELIGRPEVLTNAAARVQFEEGLGLLKEGRKKIEERPKIQ